MIQRITANRLFGISSANPWIINGEYISGTIVALLKARYPSIAVGCIVSGPVNFELLAPKLNTQIYKKVESAGSKCRNIIAKLKKEV